MRRTFAIRFGWCLVSLLLQGGEEGLDAAGMLERLFWDVGRFSASAGQRDDITAIVVRVTGK